MLNNLAKIPQVRRGRAEIQAQRLAQRSWP